MSMTKGVDAWILTYCHCVACSFHQFSEPLLYDRGQKEARQPRGRHREWYDRAGVKHMLADAELVRSLPYRMQGWSWAVFVDDSTGLTLDQPEYDPWGEIWRRKLSGSKMSPPG
jgi:hypothetical protein